MAMLEAYKVKPEGLPRMTVTALDNTHLGYILTDMCKNGYWRGLPDSIPLEITPPQGEISKPIIKDFRS
jgi:hypothetical protein